MNRREALRLKAGDKILFGEGPSSYKTDRWWTGEVLFVTPRGGIRVRVIEGRSPGGWDGPGTGPGVGTERWVAYHHIHSKRP